MTVHSTNEAFWESWKSVRQEGINTGAPVFLLLPEIRVVLNAAETWDRHILLSVLWKSGMKINEAMSMTVGDCEFDGQGCIIIRINHPDSVKQRRKRQGLMSRVVEIHDPFFVGDFKRYVKSKQLKNSVRSWLCGFSSASCSAFSTAVG